VFCSPVGVSLGDGDAADNHTRGLSASELEGAVEGQGCRRPAARSTDQDSERRLGAGATEPAHEVLGAIVAHAAVDDLGHREAAEMFGCVAQRIDGG
jgi:hypothetical protein